MGENNENLISEIRNMFEQGMESSNSKIESHINVIHNNMKELEKKINGNIDQKFEFINAKVETLGSDNKEIKTTLQEQNERIEALEKKDKGIDRSLNIIIYGIKDETYPGILNQIIALLKGIDVDITKYCIKAIFKIGRKKWNEDGPVRVSFISSILRTDVMRNKHKLKNNQNNVTIREDLSEKDRDVRNKLSTYSQYAKNKGKKVFMRYDKLVIDGKPWSLEELQELDSHGNQDIQTESEGITMESDASTSNNDQQNNTNPRKRGHPVSPFGPTVYRQTMPPSSKKVKIPKVPKDNNQQSLQDMWNAQFVQIGQTQSTGTPITTTNRGDINNGEES